MNFMVEYFIDRGGNHASEFVSKNPEFDTPEFVSYMICNNKAGLDAGDLQNLAKHEVLRLAFSFSEELWLN